MSPHLEFETTEFMDGEHRLSISMFGNSQSTVEPRKMLDLAWWLRDKVVPWLEKEALRLDKVNRG
jgi:hypothetical protein